MSRTRARYILPTGISLLSNKVLEMMQSHTSGTDYKYDHFPIIRISEAINDQNTVLLTYASEEGVFGESDRLK
jgi:hypothetical protein